MRTSNLVVILFAAACGANPPPTVPAPPPTGTEAPSLDTPEPVAKSPVPPPQDPHIAEAKQFVAELEPTLRTLLVNASLADWANETDITKEHEAASAKASEVMSVEITKLVKDARRFTPYLDKLDPDTRRQLMLLTFQATPAPDDAKQAADLAEIATEMTSLYGKGVCEGPPPGPGKPAAQPKCKVVDDYSKILQTSRNPAQILAAWTKWHNTIGTAERPLFTKYVELANIGARAIGFKDVASLWKSNYDMPEDQFEADVDRLWLQVKPLYDQLHCYTRRTLNKMYGDKVVPKTGPIPAHLLGNMWAQSWDYLYPELEPYKGVAPIDVTPVLAKTYDAKKMVEMGEAFYTSLGMDPLPPTFWDRSQLVKPKDKDVVCHASAWDVQYNDDLRIKMCIEPKQEDLWTIHHELGHDYYFQQYYKLPIIYQAGANDGFHEAIGDTIQLSMTPEYLKQKGLLAAVTKNDKATINQQMKVALEKVAFLPFAIMVDKWRWDVFSGKAGPEQFDQHWWELRLKYQGVSAPRTPVAAMFDAGAKFHVASNTPYMRYFLAHILQFQFHRALCKKAGFTGPLNECSIYGNKAAGAAYQKMLALGASKPWQNALYELTGETDMDATAILEYFAPLQKWLEDQNKGQSCGW